MTPGFADPVHDAQGCFRAVLEAMSRPGTVASVPVSAGGPPALSAAAAAVALTLLDADTAVFLDPAFEAARGWIAFHCGTPFVGVEGAAFGIAAGLPEMGAFAAGTDDEPQAGATLIVELPALRGGPGLRLSGPGVDGSAVAGPAGLPGDFVARWGANHRLFPRGVDLILCSGAEVMALPRSTRVEVG